MRNGSGVRKRLTGEVFEVTEFAYHFVVTKNVKRFIFQ